MQSRHYFTLGLMGLLSTASCSADTNEGLPLRADCIAGFELVWKHDGDTKEQAVRDLFKELPLEPHVRGGRLQDGDLLYVILDDNCEDRYVIAETYLRDYSLSNGEPFEIIPLLKRIEPGPDTIQVYGDAWRDREEFP